MNTGLRRRVDGLIGQHEAKQESQVKRGLDGDIRVARLATTLAGVFGSPGVDRVGREPDRQAAALDEGAIVGSPVCDTVSGLVARMDLRSLRHPLIIVQRRYQGKSDVRVDSCTNAQKPYQS
jgi:hypothetical protein